MPDPSLLELQEWMSIVVQHRRDAKAGARSKAAKQIIPERLVRRGEVVLESERMDVYEHLDVYNGGYFARLRGVLEMDFPCLVHALGDQAWRHLALGYLERHPSTHPNLNRLNRHLPEFIAARQGLPNRAFLRDLARLEVAMTEAFDAPEFTTLQPELLQELTPEQWQKVTLEPNPSLRVLAFGYPVNSYLQAVFDEKYPDIPERRRSYLAVYRKHDKIWRAVLPRPMYSVLRALVSGKPLQQALLAAGNKTQDLSYWFGQWSDDGLFAAASWHDSDS